MGHLSRRCARIALAAALPLLLTRYASAAASVNYLLPFEKAAGGTTAFTLTVKGSGFTMASKVYWNNVLKTTTFISDKELRATINPSDIAFPNTYPVKVQGGSTSNQGSVVVYFTDVAPGHAAYDYANLIVAKGITAGCTNTTYCPSQTLTRAQMAVLLLKAKLGSSYVPPPATGTIFADVHANDFAAAWIEDLYNRDITEGCQTGPPLLYCPNGSTTREEMSAFLLKSRYGSGYNPQGCVPGEPDVFQDVPCATNPLAEWVEDAYNRGIFAFCNTQPLRFCPATAMDRGAMAQTISDTWNYTDVVLHLNSDDPNFRLAGAASGSVVYAETFKPDVFSAFMTNAIRRFCWGHAETPAPPLPPCPTFYCFPPPNNQALGDFVTQPPVHNPNTGCKTNPQLSTNPGCGDQWGLFWKHITCSGGIPCGANDRWNAYPGTDNISAYPSPTTWPPANGFVNIVNYQTINAVFPNGFPVSGPSNCHPDNPGDRATASSVPRVIYHTGMGKYFAAFNENVNQTTPSSCGGQGWTGSDNWRVLWAYSTDGGSWTLYPGFLFANHYEKFDCGTGFQVLDLLFDNGYFYMLVQSPDTHIDGEAQRLTANHLYLLRSAVTTNPSQNPQGFTTWSLASYPLQSNGEYTWTPVTTPVTPTTLQNFEIDQNGQPRGYPIMDIGQLVNQQAAISRVFTSAAPNSPSRYVGITSEGQGVGGGGPVMYCFTTSSLTKPFARKTVVDNAVPNLTPGGFGWYFSYTHFQNNIPASPMVYGSAFDFWMDASEFHPPQAPSLDIRNILKRVGSKLTGYVYWP